MLGANSKSDSVFAYPISKLVEPRLGYTGALVVILGAALAVSVDAVDNPSVESPPIRVYCTATHSVVRVALVAELLAEDMLDPAVRMPHACVWFIPGIAVDVYDPLGHVVQVAVVHDVRGGTVHDDHCIIVRRVPVFRPALDRDRVSPPVQGALVRVAVLGPSEV